MGWLKQALLIEQAVVIEDVVAEHATDRAVVEYDGGADIVLALLAIGEVVSDYLVRPCSVWVDAGVGVILVSIAFLHLFSPSR